MSNSVGLTVLAVCFLGLMGFAYSGYFLADLLHTRNLRWREWISLASVSLILVAGIFRFVMPLFWGNDFGTQVITAQKWTKVSVQICAAALLLGIVGRPRLILPILLASAGTATFWVMSTIP